MLSHVLRIKIRSLFEFGHYLFIMLKLSMISIVIKMPNKQRLERFVIAVPIDM